MKRSIKAVALGATALAAGLVSAGALAQAPDVITVTAQKREQTLQETPVSVAVVTDTAIEQSQIRDAADLSTLVPSLRVAEFAASSNTQFTLRGIGTSSFNPGLEPSVGVFVDGVYRPRAGAAINDLLSIERVEVIRGPQSTLFGRNTPAGVVSFITKEPEFELGADAELTIGNYGQLVAKGTITGPLNDSETLAFRLDATTHSNTGYIDNVSPSASQTEINNRDRQNYRGQLLWLPSDNTEVRIIADYGTIDENCCAAPFGFYDPIDQGALIALGGTALPANPFDGRMAVDGNVNTELETAGISAQIDREFDGFTFTSITAYRTYDEAQNIDADFSDLDLVNPRQIDNEYNSFTQEFRVTSNGGERIDWMGGFFYYNNELTFNQDLGYGVDAKSFFDLASQAAVADIVASINAAAPGTLPANAGGITVLDFFVGANNATGVLGVPTAPAAGYIAAGQTVDENYQYDTQSWSAFGQLDFNLTDQFTITVGARYTEEDKDMATDITINDPISAFSFTDLATNLRFINPALCPAFPNGNSCPFLLPTLLAGAAATDPALAAQLEGALVASGIPGATLANPLVVYDPNVAAFLANTPFNLLNDFAAFQNFSPVNASQYPTSRSDDNLSYNVILSYDVSDTFNVYASYSTGFKPGGFNLSYEAVETGVFEFQDETASSWEIGAKGSLLDGSMVYAVTYFNQEIEDFQSENFVGNGFALDNAGSIEVSGIELDVQWAATDRLFFTLGGTWLIDDKYGEYEFAPCPDSSPLLGPVYDPTNPLFSNCATPRTNDAGVTGNFNNLTGVDRGNSELVGAFTGTYVHPIGDTMELTVRGEATYSSEFALVTGLDPRPVANQDDFTLYNASLILSDVDERWAVQLWGRNITDEEYVKGGFPSVGYLGASFNNYPGDPQTYGLTLRLRY
jgi:outer membrane receptor protein involved in Fe transport